MKLQAERPLVASGLLLGIGMGGFLDGIVFHQLLQFHNMLSAQYPPTSIVNLEVNMFWDGVFHLLTWIITAIGIAMLWRTAQRGDVILSTRALMGSMIAGWGLFNLVEGVINHHLLQLHHVREIDGNIWWDLGFLGGSLFLLGTGVMLIRSANDWPSLRASTPGMHH